MLTIFPHKTLIISTLFQLPVITARLFRMAPDTECHQILWIVPKYDAYEDNKKFGRPHLYTSFRYSIIDRTSKQKEKPQPVR